ncbi:metallophosphoesterase family protein [Thermodesulfovibrio hydrogeniphilus]
MVDELIKVFWVKPPIFRAEAIKQKVDKIYHLGDLGGYAPFVNEVVDFLIEHKIEGVQGNYDDAVANNKEHCGCKYEDPIQAKMAHISFEWTKKHVTEKSKNYMRSLPFEIGFSADMPPFFGTE